MVVFVYLVVACCFVHIFSSGVAPTAVLARGPLQVGQSACFLLVWLSQGKVLLVSPFLLLKQFPLLSGRFPQMVAFPLFPQVMRSSIPFEAESLRFPEADGARWLLFPCR